MTGAMLSKVEDVLIKKKMGGANFDLNIVKNTVGGVKLKLKKE